MTLITDFTVLHNWMDHKVSEQNKKRQKLSEKKRIHQQKHSWKRQNPSQYLFSALIIIIIVINLW